MKIPSKTSLLILAMTAAELCLAARVDTVQLSGGESWIGTEATTVGVFRVTGDANTVLVPEGVTVTLEDLKGAGALVKTGAGLLVIDDVAASVSLQVQEGRVHFDRSIGVESLAGAAALHLDASKAATITLGEVSGATGVTKWTDVRGETDYPWAVYDWGCVPDYRENAQNGRATVDLGVSCDWPSARFFLLGNYQGDDATHGSGSQANGIKKIKEFFIVAKDQPGMIGEKQTYQWFLGDDYDNFNTSFMRGSTGAIWSQGDFGADTWWLNNGTTWIDGVETSAAASYPAGFHVLRARGKTAGGRTSRLGYSPTPQKWSGLNYGEIILFKADVDDDVAADLSRRLVHKWLGRQTMSSLSASSGATVSVAGDETVSVTRTDGIVETWTDGGLIRSVPSGTTVTLAADASFGQFLLAGELVVAEGCTCRIAALTDGSTGVKSGAGTLQVVEVAPTASVTVRGGTLQFVRSEGVEDLAGAAALHLDASKAATITLGEKSGATGVTKWTDVRCAANYPWAKYDWGSAPFYRENAQNGLATVDLGVSCDWPTARFLSLDNYQGDDATHGSEKHAMGIKAIKEIFVVAQDQPGTIGGKLTYQCFLGDNYWNFNTFFMRGSTGAIWSQGEDYSQTWWLNNGTTWLDGVETSPGSSYPEGFHVLRARGLTAGGRFSHLGYSPTPVKYSGMNYGEIIIFKEDVKDDVAAEMSRRLVHKWLGRQTMGAVAIEGGRIQVSAGETLEVPSLALGSCAWTYGDRTVSPATLTVAETGTIDVTFGTAAKVKTGTVIELFAARTTLEGAGNFANWTIRSADREHCELTPTVIDNRLCATVRNTNGFILTVR